MVRHIIEGYWKDVHLKHGYELIYSPHIAKVPPPPARPCTRKHLCSVCYITDLRHESWCT